MKRQAGLDTKKFEEYFATFTSMDVDDDGVISKEDLSDYLSPLFGYEVARACARAREVLL